MRPQGRSHSIYYFYAHLLCLLLLCSLYSIHSDQKDHFILCCRSKRSFTLFLYTHLYEPYIPFHEQVTLHLCLLFFSCHDYLRLLRTLYEGQEGSPEGYHYDAGHIRQDYSLLCLMSFLRSSSGASTLPPHAATVNDTACHWGKGGSVAPMNETIVRRTMMCLLKIL